MKVMFGDAVGEVFLEAVDWIAGANLAVLKETIWPLFAIKCRQFQCRAVTSSFGRTVLHAVVVDSVSAQRQAVRSSVAPNNPRSVSYLALLDTEVLSRAFRPHC
jgi:hypothetical protein